MSTDIVPDTSEKSSDTQPEIQLHTFEVCVRRVDSPLSTAHQFLGRGAAAGEAAVNALRQALDYNSGPLVEAVVEWKGKETLAVVDHDYHAGSKPDEWHVKKLKLKIQPAPVVSHLSHGGGLKAYYVAGDGFTAEELAVLGKLWLSLHDSYKGTTEIKRQSRHPCYPCKDGRPPINDVVWGTANAVADVVVASILGSGREIGDSERDDYLNENGWALGQRLNHDYCPIAPGVGEPSSDPVLVGDYGIYCFVCNAKGRAYNGHRKPGFASYGQLVRGHSADVKLNPLRLAVKGFCHFEHAKHIVYAVLGLTGVEAEAAYHALLKVFHLPKAVESEEKEYVKDQIQKCFFPPRRIGRVDGGWAHAPTFGRRCSANGTKEIIQSLPAVKYYCKETKEPRVDRTKVAEFTNNGDLTLYGYPSLEPAGGIDFVRLVGWNPPITTSVPALIPLSPPFEYRPPERRNRYTRDDIQAFFPNVNFGLLELLIAASAFCQLRPPEPPRIYIVGQSGAGKTAHVCLAAEMLGGTSGDVPATLPRDQWMRAYADKAAECLFVFTDEVAKSGRESTELAEYTLSVRRGATYHGLYVGTQQITRVVPHIFADTKVYESIRVENQLSRRFVYVLLGSGIGAGTTDWRKSAGEISGWRKNFAPECDAFVSEVIDRVKASGCMVFEDYAEHVLGFTTFANQGAKSPDDRDGFDVEAVFVDLFLAVCAADNPSDTDAKRWSGKGWKIIDLDKLNSKLTDAYKACEIDGKVDEQHITGRQWGRLLNVKGVECDFSKRGRKIGIRFRVGNCRSTTTLYNEDLLPPNHRLRQELMCCVS